MDFDHVEPAFNGPLDTGYPCFLELFNITCRHLLRFCELLVVRNRAWGVNLVWPAVDLLNRVRALSCNYEYRACLLPLWLLPQNLAMARLCLIFGLHGRSVCRCSGLDYVRTRQSASKVPFVNPSTNHSPRALYDLRA